MMKEIRLDLEGGGYAVRIGRGSLGPSVAEAARLAAGSGKAAVLSDANVYPLYGRTVSSALAAAGFEPAPVIFGPGEGSKSLATLEEVSGKMLEAGLDRSSCLVALGGGVTGDLGGFAAAVYMRGIPFVMAPTSLLAQVDSSVGGKVAVNHPSCKNMIGLFARPAAVIVDPGTLQTLPAGEISEGMAEAIKHALIGGEDFFSFLEASGRAIAALDLAALDELVARCVELKASIVVRDERDSKGIRAVLNLGHTVGHALESLSGGAVRHGRGVSVGMMAACRIAEKMAGFPPDSTRRLEALLKAFALPVALPEGADPGAILEAAGADKKRAGGAIRWTLPASIGRVESGIEVPAAAALEALDGLRRP